VQINTVMLPELDAPKLRAYPRYTVMAEKLEALVSLGIANSRMKDYFDLWILSRSNPRVHLGHHDAGQC
jgi:hypothetical protein